MKRRQLAALLMAGTMTFGLAACGAEKQEQKDVTNEKQEEMQTESQTADADTETTDNTSDEEENVEYEGDATSYYIELYKSVLDTHYQAINEQWDEGKLLEEGLSPLISYCYEGEALKNIGYAFQDIDNDGSYELFIEPISGDEFVDQMVFEMYTCKNDEVKQVFCGDARSRYYLGDTEEGPYFVYNYSSSGATQSMWNYFTLEGDQLTLMQGILYDEENGDNPWSFSFDDGEEATEEMAKDIIDSYDKRRIQPEAIDFSLYQ